MFEKICIILLVNLLFFAKTITYKYVSDDIPVSQRPKPKEWWRVRLLQLEGCIRTTPQEDHLLTTIIHSLVCVFIYLGFGANDISFLASFLFAFNPINNQASVWISGRGYALSALGMTGAIAFPYIGAFFLLLAAYSNAGFLAPLALIGSKNYWLLGFMPFIWLFYLKMFKKNVVDKINQEMYDDDKRIHISKLILGVKTFSFYFIHSLIPIKTTFYHSYMQSLAGSGKEKAYSLKDRFFWIGLIIVGFILYRFIFCKWDMINFGILWWCICIAPFCNLFRMSQEIAERYVYLPNCGLMFVLASFLIQYPVIYSAWIAMYATKLWFWMDSYMDDYYLVENSCMHSPDAWFVWHVRAMKRWDNKSYPEAVTLWTMARIISPKEFKILFNLATALKLAKYEKEADEFMKMASENIPKGQEKMANSLMDKWHKGELPLLL